MWLLLVVACKKDGGGGAGSGVADNGDTMVVWSLAGRLERVTTDGDSVWSAITNAGTVFGFGEHYTSPYEPTSAPD